MAKLPPPLWRRVLSGVLSAVSEWTLYASIRVGQYLTPEELAEVRASVRPFRRR